VTHDFTHVPVAQGLRRLTGLIGRRDLFLLIPDCASVHTWLMRSAIDIVFLDGANTIVAIHAETQPWRIVFGPQGTRSALELPPGHARGRGMAVGHRVSL
jgi:uncharacterized membrane protein (UPF0127 family)